MSIGSTDGVNQVTGFERAWNASDKHRFARIQRQCVVQNDISIRQLPRSDLHRLVLSSPIKRFRFINSTHFRREEQQQIMSKLSSISSGRRMANWLPWSLEKRHINKVYPPLECTIQSASAPTAPPKQTPIEMESVRLASCQKKKRKEKETMTMAHLKQKKSVSFGWKVGFTLGFVRPVDHQRSEAAETCVDFLCKNKKRIR